MWQPFLQYKLLMILFGGSVLVAIMLGSFLLHALSDMMGIIDAEGNSNGYYGDMIGKEMINIFRYCGVLFALYVVLLAAICITYTHKVLGPLDPINRHIDAMIDGEFDHRIELRKNDLPVMKEQADRLNVLAARLRQR